MQLHSFSNKVFRSNPLYVLVEWGRLNQSEQNALAGLLTNPTEVFGVLKPVNSNSGLRIKIAYNDVALLFYFLQQPGELPNYVKQAYDDEMNTTLAKLVMEDVLQLKWNEDFVSGPNAFKTLYKNLANTGCSSAKHIETISKKAIEYVLELNHLDVGSAMVRLYNYNTIPSLENSFDIAETTERFQKTVNSWRFEKELLQHWTKHLPTDTFKWLAFNRKHNEMRRNSDNITYKIYVSPLPSCFIPVYEKTVKALCLTKAFSFKTGIDQRVFRPDNFVIYFHTYNDMKEAALLLKEELTEFDAQGVPFTAQLDDKGLLSWGIDPPRNDVTDGVDGGSWRARMVEKLAVAVVQAKSAQLTKDDAYDYVMNKIFLEKINPFTWVPQESYISNSLYASK